MTMLLLSVLLACDLIEDLKSDDSESSSVSTGEDSVPEGATRNSQMPSEWEESRKDWNCDFLTQIANTGLEEYGLVAIDLETTIALYADAEIPLWDRAANGWTIGVNMVHGEVEYDGFFFPMTDTVVPGYMVASVKDAPVDFNLCRGYLWVEGL